MHVEWTWQHEKNSERANDVLFNSLVQTKVIKKSNNLHESIIRLSVDILKNLYLACFIRVCAKILARFRIKKFKEHFI